MADRNIPQPGEVLAGKFEVVRVVASGGMGVVLEATNRRTGQHVALKLLHAPLRARADVTLRFEREGRTAGKLESRHVARILDVDSLEDGSPFLVMELLRGRDLGDELAERKSLPYEEAVGWVLEACAAMAEAHAAGIVHRDLKPSNLFLAEEQGGRVLKVLDFGISKTTEESDVRMTATHSVLGTPLYMSPEHVRSTKDVDARSDIWSLGVILYELVTGDTPFHGGAATAIAAAIVADDTPEVAAKCPWLPPPLAAEIMRALAKRASERHQDVFELARGLAPYGGERGRAAIALLGARGRFDSITIVPSSAVAAAPGDAATMVDTPGAHAALLADTDPDTAAAGARSRASSDATALDATVAVPAPAQRRGVVVGASAVALGALALFLAFGRGASTAGPSQGVVLPQPPSPATATATALAASSVAPSGTGPTVLPGSAAAPSPDAPSAAAATPSAAATATSRTRAAARSPATTPVVATAAPAPPPRPAPIENPLHL